MMLICSRHIYKGTCDRCHTVFECDASRIYLFLDNGMFEVACPLCDASTAVADISTTSESFEKAVRFVKEKEVVMPTHKELAIPAREVVAETCSTPIKEYLAWLLARIDELEYRVGCLEDLSAVYMPVNKPAQYKAYAVPASNDPNSGT